MKEKEGLVSGEETGRAGEEPAIFAGGMAAAVYCGINRGERILINRKR